MKFTIENNQERGTRDWKGFFKALAAAMATILPLITPLFSTTKPRN